jgi:hypothetical protein
VTFERIVESRDSSDALGIDDEQSRTLTAHLAAEDQVDVEFELVALQRGPIEVRHAPHLLADDSRSVVERRRLR